MTPMSACAVRRNARGGICAGGLALTASSPSAGQAAKSGRGQMQGAGS